MPLEGRIAEHIDHQEVDKNIYHLLLDYTRTLNTRYSTATLKVGSGTKGYTFWLKTLGLRTARSKFSSRNTCRGSSPAYRPQTATLPVPHMLPTPSGRPRREM